MTAPVRRTSVPAAVGENRERIRILEATLAGGIQFGGADPIYGDQNFGEYLYVETAGAPSPVGFSMFFNALGGELSLVSDDQINLIAPEVLAQVTVDFTIRLEDDGSFFQVDDTTPGGGFPTLKIDYDTRSTVVHLNDNDSQFEVRDSADASILAISEDGTTVFTLAAGGSQWGIFKPGFVQIMLVDANARSAAFNVDNFYVQLMTAGDSLQVADSGGNNIFQINEDGSLQGKTGQSLVFNL